MWVTTNKCMYVKHIPQHNNLNPTSSLITLTVFVAGATKSPIYKHRPEVNFGPGAWARWNRLYSQNRNQAPDIIIAGHYCLFIEKFLDSLLLPMGFWSMHPKDTLLSHEALGKDLWIAVKSRDNDNMANEVHPR